MIPSYSPATSDNESLQADVMRFMAIIAFCLIAILALVKEAGPIPAAPTKPVLKSPAVTADVEVAPSPQAPAEPETVETPVPVDEPALVVEPVEPQPLNWQAPIEKPAADAGRTEATPKPAEAAPRLEVAALTTSESAVTQTDSRSASQAAQPADESVQQTPEPAAAQPAMEKTPEQGLSLRFASPGDFLRLIARAQISVYAFNASGEVLGLNSTYHFLPARSPGQVYELLPQTIPALIVDALRQAPQTSGADGFSWGITLPRHIEDKITGYLASAASGELVIDRYGDVHHVVAN